MVSTLLKRSIADGWGFPVVFFIFVASFSSGLIIPYDLLYYRGDMAYFHALEIATRDALATGELPLWNIYFAEPLLANPQAMVLYPINVLFRFVPVPILMYLQVVLNLWLAGVSFYMFLRDIEIDNSIAIIGAIIFPLSFHAGTKLFVGHIVLLSAIPWSIFVLLFFRRLLVKREWKHLYFAVISLVFLILSGHTQYALTALVIPVSYGVYYLIQCARDENWTHFAQAIGLGLLLGIMASGILAIQLLPTAEYFQQTTRSREGFSFDSATQGSLSWVELTTLFTPYAVTDAFPDEAIYFWEGILFLITPGLGFAFISLYSPSPSKRRFAIYVMIIAGCMVIISMGSHTPVYQLIYKVAPFIRIPRRFTLVWTFCLSVLITIGIENILVAAQAKRAHFIRILQANLGFSVGALLLLLTLHLVRKGTLQNGELWLSTVFSLLIILLWLTVLIAINQEKYQRHTYSFLLATVALELILLSVYFAFWSPYRIVYPEYTEYFTSAELMENLEELDYPPEDVRLSGFMLELKIRIFAIHKIAGFHPYSANLAYMSDLGRYEYLSGSDYRLYDEPFDDPSYRVVDQTNRFTLYESVNNMPRVYGADTTVLIDDDDESLEYVIEIDPHTVVLVNSATGPELSGDGNTAYRADITHYSANRVQVEVETDEAMMLVITDPYYPGWQAEVNGQEQPIWRVNHGFRGIQVEPGTTAIILTFQPTSYRVGLLITLTTLGTMGLAALILRKAPR